MSDPRKKIPTKETDARGWQEWHKSLSSVMSISDANEVWKAYWASYGGAFKDDKELRDYMKNHGVDISNALDIIRDKGLGAVQTIRMILKGGRIVTLGIAAIIVFAILKALLNVAKDPIGATNAVGNLKNGGLR